MINLATEEMKLYSPTLVAGNEVCLTGYIYTARDAAHKRLKQMIDADEELPIELDGATIYYTGPTQAKKNLPIGACGPTTSSRMDQYTPDLLSMGVSCIIGKGELSIPVIDSISSNDAVYLCALGGGGAIACKAVKSVEVVAFEDLGCESIKRIYVDSFKLIVAIDCHGNDLFRSEREKYRVL